MRTVNTNTIWPAQSDDDISYALKNLPRSRAFIIPVHECIHKTRMRVFNRASVLGIKIRTKSVSGGNELAVARK